MEAMLAVPLDQRPIYTKLMEATDIDCMGRKFYLPRHVGRHFQFADGDANTSATIANVQFIGYDMLLDEHLHLSKTRSAGNFPNYSIGSGWIECLAQQNMGEGDVIEFYVSPNNALNTMYIRHIPLYGDSSDEEEDFSDDAESTSSDEDESSSGEDRSSSDEDEDGSSSDEDEDENSSDEDGSSSDEYGNSSDEDGNGSSSDEDNGTKEDTSANEASDDIKHGAKINEVEGDVEKLYKDVAPKTVNFFRALCTGEKGLNGHKPLHYKGTRFIPVVRGVLVQGEDISSGETKYGESIYRALSVDVMVDNFGEIPEGADDGTINFFTDWPIDFKENLDDLPRDIAAVESSKALGNEWFKKQNYKMAMRKYCKSLRYLDLCWEMKGIDGDQGQYVRKVKSRNFNNIALIIACKKGGASIEDLVEKHPELIIKAPIDVFTGITDEDAAKVVDGLSIKVADRSASIEQVRMLYDLFCKCDCTLVEINPIAETADNQLVAADAKLKFDHNTAYHQKEIFAYRDPTQVDPREADLNYIGLDGEIGCLVNGSGLANATMDIIKLHGGTPANFLDVGGNASEGQVVEAFKILMVNIVGGIMKCDVIASGIVNVAKQDCMLKLGDLKGALMHGDFAIHDGRDNAKAFFCQGQVYMALNNTDGAIESFGKALELQPNNSSIKKEIALAKKKITHGDGVEKKAYSKMFQ